MVYSCRERGGTPIGIYQRFKYLNPLLTLELVSTIIWVQAPFYLWL